MNRNETAELLGLSFDTVTMETAVARCLELCRAPRTSHMVITANASHLCMMRRDPQLALACRAAHLTVADGMSVVWALRASGQPAPERVAGVDRNEQYRAHVADSLAASPWARVIKASDFTDNGVGLIHTSGPKVPRLARKYAPLVPMLADLIARPDTPLAPPVKARILGQLVAAQQRFAVITQAPASGTDSLATAGR